MFEVQRCQGRRQLNEVGEGAKLDTILSTLENLREEVQEIRDEQKNSLKELKLLNEKMDRLKGET